MAEAEEKQPSALDHLSFLSTMEELLIVEDTEPMEIEFGYYKKQKYNVIDRKRKIYLFALEEPYFCRANTRRPYTIRVYDQYRTQLINLKKPLPTNISICSQTNNNLQEMQVFTPDLQFLGEIKQKWSSWKPAFNVEDQSKNSIFNIKGPMFRSTDFTHKNIEYTIMCPENIKRFGKIIKYANGVDRRDKYSRPCVKVKFLKDIPIYHKLLLLSTGFFLEYMDKDKEKPEKQSSS